jgi:hypothetical protein
MKIVIYPARTEPVAVPSAAPLVTAGYLQQNVDPPRASSFAALALLAALTASAFVAPVPAQERTTPDKWQTASNQPLFELARKQYSQPPFAGPDRQQLPDLDSWIPAANQPQFDQPRKQYLHPAFGPGVHTVFRERTAQPDKWAPLPNQPLFDLARRQQLYPEETNLYPLPVIAITEPGQGPNVLVWRRGTPAPNQHDYAPKRFTGCSSNSARTLGRT